MLPSLQNLVIDHNVWNVCYMMPIFPCPKLALTFQQWAVLDCWNRKEVGSSFSVKD